MFDYSFTDEETVSRISDVCPRAMASYFIVLNKVSDNQEILIFRDEFMDIHHKSWTKFKNDLRSLARLFIIDFLDEGNQVRVGIIDMQECA